MARIRTIKPEFWQDDDLAEISEPALIVAAGLLNHSDDEGFFKANPMLIKSQIFPLREPSVNVHDILIELSNIDYIRLFLGSDDKPYGEVVSFMRHQKINRPSPSKIKGLEVITDDSLNPHGVLTAGKERKGKEQGKERKGKEASLPSRKLDDSASDILDHLNNKLKTGYKHVDSNLKLINARLKEGHTKQDVLDVIDMKIGEWKDSKSEMYLRPATLFNAEKFNQYIGVVGAYRDQLNGVESWMDDSRVIEGVIVND